MSLRDKGKPGNYSPRPHVSCVIKEKGHIIILDGEAINVKEIEVAPGLAKGMPNLRSIQKIAAVYEIWM